MNIPEICIRLVFWTYLIIYNNSFSEMINDASKRLLYSFAAAIVMKYSTIVNQEYWVLDGSFVSRISILVYYRAGCQNFPRSAIFDSSLHELAHVFPNFEPILDKCWSFGWQSFYLFKWNGQLIISKGMMMKKITATI